MTAAQLKIVHTALKALFDDLGHEEHGVKQVVASVLAKLPGDHEIRAIDLGRESAAASPTEAAPEVVPSRQAANLAPSLRLSWLAGDLGVTWSPPIRPSLGRWTRYP